MDKEDRERTLSNKEKVRRYLLEHRVATNKQLCKEHIGGARGMARVWDLQTEYKNEEPPRHVITVRKLKGSTWEVRLDMVPLARDAGTRIDQKPLPVVLPFQW